MHRLAATAILAALAGAALTGVGWAGMGRAGEPVVAYTITNGSEIAHSLTGAPGDAARGKELYDLEARAGCPACHGKPGTLASAPDLSGIGGRMSDGAIRLWIVAPSAVSPESGMPAYYIEGKRKGADDPLHGGPALTAAEIEDLVAYLMSLTGPGLNGPD